MIYLVITSVIWAFSFGLIQHKLVGVGLDPFVVAFLRLVISLGLFVPFVRPWTLPPRLAPRLVLLGTVQYGMMYTTYLYSYRFLESHQVALFTILTPLFVTMFADLWKRRFRRLHWLTALLAVTGAAVIVPSSRNPAGALTGILILQVSNASFAFGQLAYRKMMKPTVGARGAGHRDVRDLDVFGLLYLGGAAFAAVPMLVSGGWPEVRLDGSQLATLLYLGVVPSGVGFFLWNVGARTVNIGTLAAMNNAKIPLGVLCSLLIFGERTHFAALLVGGAALAAAVWINERGARGGLPREGTIELHEQAP